MRDLEPHEREAVIAELRLLVEERGSQTDAAAFLDISQQTVSAALTRKQVGHRVAAALLKRTRMTLPDLVQKHETHPRRGTSPNLETALAFARQQGRNLTLSEDRARAVARHVERDLSVGTWLAMLVDLEG